MKKFLKFTPMNNKDFLPFTNFYSKMIFFDEFTDLVYVLWIFTIWLKSTAINFNLYEYKFTKRTSWRI